VAGPDDVLAPGTDKRGQERRGLDPFFHFVRP
jgi:hypothetical protein